MKQHHVALIVIGLLAVALGFIGGRAALDPGPTPKVAVLPARISAVETTPTPSPDDADTPGTPCPSGCQCSFEPGSQVVICQGD